jgi:hypothetical protein
MGILLEFPSMRSHLTRPPSVSTEAEIVFFPGIRIERAEEVEAACAHPVAPARHSKAIQEGE